MKLKWFLCKGLCLLLSLCLLGGCAGKKPDTGYTRYSTEFYDTFDTIIQVIGYTET